MKNQRSRAHRIVPAAVSAALSVLLVSTALTLPSSAASAVAPLADDTTPPTLTLEYETPENEWGWHNSERVGVQIAAVEEESGLDSIYVKDGATGAITVWSSPLITRYFTEQGSRMVEAWAVDKAGNVTPRIGIMVRIDRTLPTIDVTSPTIVEQGATAALNYTCADALSGVALCDGDLASGQMLDTSTIGTFSIALHAKDQAGNTVDREFEYTVRPSADKLPTIDYTLDPGMPASGWYNQPVDLTMTGTFPLGVGSVQYTASGAHSGTHEQPGSTLSPHLEAEGVTEVEMIARDAAGNTSEPELATVRIDRTAPTVRGAADNDFAPALRHVKQEELLDFAPICDDALSGVARCYAEGLRAGKLDTRLPGEHVLKLYAVDRAGNTGFGEYRYIVDAGRIIASKPRIVGTAKVKKTLTARVGAWRPSAVKLSYRWYRNGKAIGGASKARYKLTRKDRGKRITVKVTGSKLGYRAVATTSAKTKRVR